MGKQVNFYMTTDDERSFIDFVRASGDVIIFCTMQSSAEVIELKEMPPPGTPFWFAMCIFNRDCCSPPKLSYIKEQGYYIVEKAESEIIEFSRCGMDEGRLVRGRLWIETSYCIVNEQLPVLVKKSDGFVRWYNKLASWIKRNSSRNNVGEYLMPGAAAFSDGGGKCCQFVTQSGHGY